MPSREASESDSVPEYVPDFPGRFRLRYVTIPPASPIAQASVQVSFESFKGLAESSDNASSTSPTASIPGEDPIDEEEGENPKQGVWKELETRRRGKEDLLVRLHTTSSESGGPRGN